MHINCLLLSCNSGLFFGMQKTGAKTKGVMEEYAARAAGTTTDNTQDSELVNKTNREIDDGILHPNATWRVTVNNSPMACICI